MQVHIDEAGGDPTATRIDFDGTGGDLSLSDPFDLAFRVVKVCLVKAAAIPGEYGGVFEQDRLSCRRYVG